MEEKLNKYIGIAICFMVIWGIFGLINGNGFLGGIEIQINAIGKIVSAFIETALFVGVIWYIFNWLTKKESNEQKNNNDVHQG